MNEQNWFAESWINTEHNVLGFTLKPFSIWHLLHLKELNSPILTFDLTSKITDLELACVVCTTSFGDNVNKTIDEHLHNPERKKLKKLHHKRMMRDGSYLAKECFLFAKYYKDYATCALTVEQLGTPLEKKEDKQSSIPQLLQYITMLMVKYHMTEQQAFDLSFGKVVALCHSLAWFETGESSALSDRDIIAIKIVKGELKLNADLTVTE